MRDANRILGVAIVGVASLLLPTSVQAEDAAATSTTTATEGIAGAGSGAGSGSAKIRYKKHKQVDFSSKTIEGKLKRPETALITASEGLDSNGILRLRENFLDKFAADAGEEVP